VVIRQGINLYFSTIFHAKLFYVFSWKIKIETDEDPNRVRWCPVPGDELQRASEANKHRRAAGAADSEIRTVQFSSRSIKIVTSHSRVINLELSFSRGLESLREFFVPPQSFVLQRRALVIPLTLIFYCVDNILRGFHRDWNVMNGNPITKGQGISFYWKGWGRDWLIISWAKRGFSYAKGVQSRFWRHQLQDMIKCVS